MWSALPSLLAHHVLATMSESVCADTSTTSPTEEGADSGPHSSFVDPVEGHENNRSIHVHVFTDETRAHVNISVPLMDLQAGLIKTDEIGKRVIQKMKDLGFSHPHRTTEATTDKPPSMTAYTTCTEEVNSTHSQEFQFATGSQIERKNDSLPRHNSNTESSKEKEFPDSKIDKKESAKVDDSDKEETDYENFETSPAKAGFDDLSDLVFLQIFKHLGASDRLRLEGVNSRWQRLLIESWKDVRVLNVWDIYSPSLTDDDIEFLRNRVTPFVKKLDFGSFPWPKEEDEEEEEEVDEEDKWRMLIGRKIFSSLCCPPCALEELVLWNVLLDQSTLFCLRRIGHQITSIEVRISHIKRYPEEPTEDPEDRRSFFELFPNLKRLACTFLGIYDYGYHVSCQWDTLPSSLEYLNLMWVGVAFEDYVVEEFFNLEQSLCSLRELHLTHGTWIPHVGEMILGRLAVRFPNLEVLEIDNIGHLSRLERLGPLKKLRELALVGGTVDLGFLSHALSFEFREQLESLLIRIRNSFLPQEQLENLSCFPNLKDLSLTQYDNGRMELGVNTLEKIAKGCKKLQRFSFDPCGCMNNDGLKILGKNCPDLRLLNVSHCAEIWRREKEGIWALLSGDLGMESSNEKLEINQSGVSESLEILESTFDLPSAQ